MRTVLSLIQTAATELGLVKPAVVVSSSDTGTQQLLSLLTMVGESLINDFEFQDITKEYTFTTIAGTDLYSLPSDFGNIINQTAWDRTTRLPLFGPKSSQEWQYIKGSLSSAGTFRTRFRIIGNQIKLHPVPSSANQIYFEYVSTAWVKDATGTLKTSITADSDTLVFDDRLMIAGIKLKYREAQGLDTTSVARDWEYQYRQVLDNNKGAPTLNLAPRQNTGLLSTANIPDGSWTV